MKDCEATGHAARETNRDGDLPETRHIKTVVLGGDVTTNGGLVDARFLALAVQVAYHHKSGGKETIVQSYRDTRNLLDAIYASSRLVLPLDGIMLIGY